MVVRVYNLNVIPVVVGVRKWRLRFPTTLLADPTRVDCTRQEAALSRRLEVRLNSARDH